MFVIDIASSQSSPFVNASQLTLIVVYAFDDEGILINEIVVVHTRPKREHSMHFPEVGKLPAILCLIH